MEEDITNNGGGRPLKGLDQKYSNAPAANHHNSGPQMENDPLNSITANPPGYASNNSPLKNASNDSSAAIFNTIPANNVNAAVEQPFPLNAGDPIKGAQTFVNKSGPVYAAPAKYQGAPGEISTHPNNEANAGSTSTRVKRKCVVEGEKRKAYLTDAVSPPPFNEYDFIGVNSVNPSGIRNVNSLRLAASNHHYQSMHPNMMVLPTGPKAVQIGGIKRKRGRPPKNPPVNDASKRAILYTPSEFAGVSYVFSSFLANSACQSVYLNATENIIKFHQAINFPENCFSDEIVSAFMAHFYNHVNINTIKNSQNFMGSPANYSNTPTQYGGAYNSSANHAAYNQFVASNSMLTQQPHNLPAPYHLVQQSVRLNSRNNSTNTNNNNNIQNIVMGGGGQSQFHPQLSPLIQHQQNQQQQQQQNQSQKIIKQNVGNIIIPNVNSGYPLQNSEMNSPNTLMATEQMYQQLNSNTRYGGMNQPRQQHNIYNTGYHQEMRGNPGVMDPSIMSAIDNASMNSVSNRDSGYSQQVHNNFDLLKSRLDKEMIGTDPNGNLLFLDDEMLVKNNMQMDKYDHDDQGESKFHS